MAVTVTAPNNMSYVNAFRAIWEVSDPAQSVYDNKNLKQLKERLAGKPELVDQLFVKMTSLHIKEFAGRVIEVNFHNFPKLEVYGYDIVYGGPLGLEIHESAKSRARLIWHTLQKYDAIPSPLRFDAHDRIKFD